MGWSPKARLQQKEETDTGYHCGADVSMLSQFQAEDEILFPPATMLTVQSSSTSGSAPRASGPPAEVSEGAKRFIEIDVQPTFV